MAEPKIEDGHIDFANELAEFMARYRISGEEWQVLLVIMRKTWGWHKPWDRISLKQFWQATGMKKPSILRALNKLLGKHIISKRANKNPYTWHINSHFDKWKVVSKKAWGMREWRGVSINQLKEKIRERDNNLCQVCGYDGKLTDEKLDVHHIDYDQTNNDSGNMITLDKSCHMRTNSHQDFWQEQLSELLAKKLKGEDISNIVNAISTFVNRFSNKANFQPPQPKSDKGKRTPKETLTKETLTKERTMIRSQISKLILQFPDELKMLIDDYIENARMENKTKEITLNKHQRLLNELWGVWSDCNIEILKADFKTALRVTVNNQVPNINYLKKVMKNIANKRALRMKEHKDGHT